MNSKRKLAPIAFIFLILGVSAALFLKPVIKDQIKLNSDNSYQFLKLNIIKIIKKDGIPKSTKRVVDAFKKGDIDINECHNLMHTLGHAAYEFHPKDWDILVSPYSTLCFFGFEHGVEAQIALSKLGDTESMYKDLHYYCQKFRNKFPGSDCYHGVGHAYMQSMSISAALSNCDKVVEVNESPEDCYRGAFSEYTNRLKGIDGDTDSPIPGVTPLVIDEKNVYDECLKLNTKYQKACAAQFTSFIYDGGKETAISKCQNYPDWISEICAFKISEANTNNYFESTKELTIPGGLEKMKFAVRKGYIDGVSVGFLSFKNSAPPDIEKKWCNKLPYQTDINYCLTHIK